MIRVRVKPCDGVGCRVAARIAVCRSKLTAGHKLTQRNFLQTKTDSVRFKFKSFSISGINATLTIRYWYWLQLSVLFLYKSFCFIIRPFDIFSTKEF